jgi:hypothetical protein
VQELDGATPPNPTANLLTGLGIDEYFQRTDSAGARSFLTDNLGSTLALADSAGTIQTQYTYDPFGATTVGGAANANSYQFTGRENDDRIVLLPRQVLQPDISTLHRAGPDWFRQRRREPLRVRS